jgi:hypothetical protein
MARRGYQMATAPEPGDLHLDLVAFKHRLPHLTEAIRQQRKIKIVAIGSSSTAGEGDVIPFPHRLELALRSRYPGLLFDVINRGIGGQEAPEELSRFESDVVSELPTLVIWQVGTNAIYQKGRYDPDAVGAAIMTGLSRLATLPTDVVLMDPQYAPALFHDDGGEPDPEKAEATRRIVSLISGAAENSGVNLFRRFELMERWVTADKMEWAGLIGPDGLHQTEWATRSVADALSAAIEGATGAGVGLEFHAEDGVREKGGQQVEATAAAQPRHVNISFLDENGQVVPRTRSLVSAQRYLVRVNIAELRQDSLITNAPPFPSDLLPQSAIGHWLEVVVSSDDLEVQPQKHSLFLPTHGPSWHCACEPGGAHHCLEKERAEFLLVAVSSLAPCEDALLRVGVYFRYNLVQSIAIRTRVMKTAEEGRPASAVSEYTLSRGFTRLEALEPVALNILTNAAADGRTHRLVFNGEPQSAVSVTIGDSQISNAIKDARASLRDLQIAALGGGWGTKVQYRAKYDPSNRKTEAEFVEDLRALAVFGRRLWQLLFAQHEKERKLLREHLRGVSRTIQVSRIQGSSFVFPWSLVYDIPIETGTPEKLTPCNVVASLPELSVETSVCPHDAEHDENTLCPFGFWGLRHVIEQPPSTGNDDLTTQISVAESRHMILGSSGDLRTESIAHGQVINANSPRLKLVDCATRSTLKAALTGQDVELIYFYCHGRYIVVPGMQDQEPYLEIGDGERVTPADITTWYEVTFPDGRAGHTQPLVFMNGCHTTEISPESLTNFVDAFVGAVASGVIGTEISMFEPIAREAGEQFWQRFLASEPQDTVGTAMRKMKLALLKKRNLMGLAYTAFCSSTLKIEKETV